MNWVVAHCKDLGDRVAIIDDGTQYSYVQLASKIEGYLRRLKDVAVHGACVAVISEYNFNSIALFFALIERRAIIVPIVSVVKEEVESRISVARCSLSCSFIEGELTLEALPVVSLHSLIEQLIAQDRSGLVLFSSGSTGAPKAMVHDFDTLLDSYKGRKSKRLRFLIFLMFDHIGGINTLLNTISMGAVAVLPSTRDPLEIGSLMQKHSVNVLPSSPTFLNLLLINGVFEQCDLSKLKMITYGTEPMPENLLKRLRATLPRVRFLQTFGTSETGITQSSSRSSDSLDMKIGTENIDYKIVEGELYLKSKTQVLGYLNANMDCFTSDGWFKTGDLVDVLDDGYIRILGRNKEIINVGGEKVLPSEVESVLLEIDEVLDVTVSGKANAITGQTVTTEVVVKSGLDDSLMKKKIRDHCRVRMSGYKVPTKIRIISEPKYSQRFKKIRLDTESNEELEAS